jgi:hypothetical protein
LYQRDIINYEDRNGHVAPSTESIIDQLPSLLVLMYKSRLALPLLELAACLPAAVLLLATLVSHAIGPGFSDSGESVSPSP